MNIKTHEETILEIKGRHDPCIVPRAVPVVEAMTAWALCDLMLCRERDLEWDRQNVGLDSQGVPGAYSDLAATSFFAGMDYEKKAFP